MLVSPATKASGLGVDSRPATDLALPRQRRSMTRFDAATAGERRSLYAEAVAAHRRRGSERVVFEAGADRLALAEHLEFAVTPRQREALDALLAEFPVFKVAQPATRKAAEGVVYVSAVTDPKHLADFVDEAFQRVYGNDEGYEGWVVEI